jgi:hypothetical protein
LYKALLLDATQRQGLSTVGGAMMPYIPFMKLLVINVKGYICAFLQKDFL